MNHFAITYLIFSVILFGEVFCDEKHDEICNTVKKQGKAMCFDRTTLGFCMLIGDEWKAMEAATCDSRLCCNAQQMGCTMNADCDDEFTTSTTASSTTKGPSSVNCVVGALKKHDSDCKKFYYCSRNDWVESECKIGVYDESRKSCAFGTCNTNNS